MHIVPRADNANRARAKVRSAVVVPVSVPLVRLYSEYMHTEYGELDSDYVFVNLFGGKKGRPMSYSAVHKLIGRVGARAGVSFTAHMLRHSRATDMVRQGVPDRGGGPLAHPPLFHDDQPDLCAPGGGRHQRSVVAGRFLARDGGRAVSPASEASRA